MYIHSLCIVCFIAMNVPPTSKEYLSVVSGETSQMDSSLSLERTHFSGPEWMQPVK